MRPFVLRAVFLVGSSAAIALACSSGSTPPPELSSGGGGYGSGSSPDASTGGNKTCDTCVAGDPNCCLVTLTPSHPSVQLSSPIKGDGIGKNPVTGYVVDVTAFASGTLVVSGTNPAGSCSPRYGLFANGYVFPATGLPPDELAAGGSSAGQPFSFTYKFAAGDRFTLFGDCSWGDPAGSSSTVALTISVPLPDGGVDAAPGDARDAGDAGDARADTGADASDAAPDVADAAGD